MSNDKTNYPPFITPRSPSYERAEQEFLHASTRDAHSEQAARGILGQLCEAERDASEVCAKMSTLLDDEELAEVVHDRGELHEARCQGIGKMIERLGGSASTAGSAQPRLTQTLDAASGASTDTSAKQALALMHKELSAVYRDASRNENLDQQQRSALASFAPGALDMTTEV